MIFFVHTCLVLMMSLEREPGAASFIIRRIFRIYPLVIVVLASIILSGIPQANLGPHYLEGYKPDLEDIIANLSLTQDFSSRVFLLSPTWSLTYEMQMYVLLPLLFAAVGTVTRSLLMYVGLLALALTVGHYWHSPRNIFLILPCFLPGILAYRLLKVNKMPKLPAFCLPFFVIAVTMAYIAAKHTAYGFYEGYPMCLALGLAIPCFKEIRFPAITRVSQIVAKYSYGIYLVHFAAIYFAFERGANLPALVQWGVFFGILTAVTVILYHTVEEPMIQFGKRIVAASRMPLQVVPNREGAFRNSLASD